MREARGLFLMSLIISLISSSSQAGAKELTRLSTPITFEENRGQAPARYRFVSHEEDGATALFSSDGMDLILPNENQGGTRIGLKILGIRPDAVLRADGHLASISNYFLGNDPKRWIQGVPQDSQIVYGKIYPGIDLVVHGHGERLEHDFRVAPGMNVGDIRFSFAGSNNMTLDGGGNLRISTASGVLLFQKPEAYQNSARGRKTVSAGFVLNSDRTVQFQVGAYDSGRELIIDPVFSFSTYLVGGGSSSTVTAVTTDSAGNVFVTGFTGAGFPIVNGEQPTIHGIVNAFVSKFDPTGHNLLYSTYLGGSGGGNAGNYGSAIVIDSTGDIIVAGISGANDFPHAGSVPTPLCQTNDACFFIVSLSPDGSSLNYAGLIGGIENISDSDYGNEGRLALDGGGNAYLAGITDDPNFQLTPGTLSSTVPGYPYNSTFVLKVNTTGALVYSTIIPGTLPLDPSSTSVDVFVPSGISVDTSGQATIAGTAGPGLPSTAGVVQPTFPNDLNNTNPNAGFVLQLNASGSAINYATYVPGTDWILGMAVDSTGNRYLTGATSETTLPVSANAYQKTIQQYQFSGFVVKMNANGTAIPAATYLEGSAGANLSGISLDRNSNAFVGGMTSSIDFPMVDPLVSQWVFGISNADMVLAGLSPDLSSLIFGSFLSSTDQTYSAPQFYALTVDSQDNLIVVGETLATDFPTTPNSFQPTAPGQSGQYQRGFVAKIDMATASPSVCLDSWGVDLGQVQVNTSSTQTVNLTNCGNAALNLTTLVSSTPIVSAIDTCGAIQPGMVCPISLTYSPIAISSVTGTVSLSDNAAISPQIFSFSGQGAPDFTTSATALSPAAVAPGGSATAIITIAPFTGLHTTVALSCSKITLNGSATTTAIPTCLFSAISPQNAIATSTLTVSTKGSSARLSPASIDASCLRYGMCLPLAGLALIGTRLASALRKKRCLRVLFCLALSGLVLLTACGGGASSGGGGGGGGGGTPVGTYTITVKGTAGSVVSTTNVTLTVQ